MLCHTPLRPNNAPATGIILAMRMRTGGRESSGSIACDWIWPALHELEWASLSGYSEWVSASDAEWAGIGIRIAFLEKPVCMGAFSRQVVIVKMSAAACCMAVIYCWVNISSIYIQTYFRSIRFDYVAQTIDRAHLIVQTDSLTPALPRYAFESWFVREAALYSMWDAVAGSNGDTVPSTIIIVWQTLFYTTLSMLLLLIMTEL